MRYLTYAEEMKAKYPNRPWASHPGWELRNMAKALSMMSLLNTPEESQRLEEVKAELAHRRKAFRETAYT
jgi:hypothetical protein